MSSDYSPLTPGALFFRPPSADDLDAIYSIEAASYPEEEAATREKLDYRIAHASNVFLVASSSGGGGGGGGDEVIGYVCGTCSAESSLTHESMSRHDPEGALLCIHSVCVAAPHRRKGVATKLLKAYLSYVQATSPQLTQASLLCKEATVKLYSGAGFKMVGPSSVVHGADQWFEMVYAFGDGDGGGSGAV